MLLVVTCTMVFSLTGYVMAKGHGGSREYSWDPKTPEERAFEHLRKGPEAYIDNHGWDILAIRLPKEVDEIKEVSPELKEKLLTHASSMLGQLEKSENQYSINMMSKALMFYQEKINFDPGVDVVALTKKRSVAAGQKAISSLAGNCKEFQKCAKKEKCNPVEINISRSNILGEIDDVLNSGTTLNEIGVESVESMRDRAECRQ